ncbi:hexose transporter hxt1 [Scheffersomyces spartinae]|uniref:Hexose transporter hxt1 n=1 Tax=Scheffersomyces spartinae TaxID=45513 RepID=A0A9P7VCA9_9ASCO|nr:hexose transporter hxt1 [Scheffersomyces spartinae]KAG7194886.1 hexose transporter hxt1 [Scheffersomyces spartinae]
MSQEPTNMSGTATPIDNGSLLKEEKETESLAQPITTKKSGWSEHLTTAIFCLLVAFGGFVFGYDTGTVSGFVNMDDFKKRFATHHADGTYKFSDTRVGLMIAILNIGCAVGGIVLSKVGDMKGRRFGISTAMSIYIVGIIVQIASQHAWYQIMIGRLITGFAIGMVSVLCPLFISETSPKAIRGTLVVCFQLFITLGILIGNIVGYGTKSYSDSVSWRVPLGLCFAWALFLLFGMSLMPESPRYLIEKNMIEEAKKSIAKSNKLSPEDALVYEEIQLIQNGIDQEKLAGSANWLELITGKPKILYRVIMGIMLQSLQQLTGDNYFFYYGTTIFKAVGLSDSFQTSIILSAVNFGSTFLGIYLIDRWGRRKVLMMGSACMFLAMLVYSILGSVRLYIGVQGDNSNTRKPVGDAMIFVTCVYILFFASTWAGGCYAVVSESYPLRIRAKAMSVAIAANWLWGFLIAFFTPFITSAIHFYYGFVFAGCLIFSFFYVYFFVYETKGLTLEEVDMLYASDAKPWNSHNWVPEEQNVDVAFIKQEPSV